MKGFAGKIGIANLSGKTFEIRELTDDLAKNFLGGPALGARLLYELMPAHTDPFDENSVIGLVASPANNTGALMGGRYTVVCKSPFNGRFNDSNSGGTFGPMLKQSGFDAIFIKGISDSPVYLFVDNGKVEFRDASAIWGKHISAAEEAIREEIGDQKICMAMIGPAGEHKSNLACIMNDSHRAAGRGGSGAVFGSKNLKCVAVRGKQKIEVYDRDTILALNREAINYSENEGTNTFNGYKVYGSTLGYPMLVQMGNTPIKNFTGIPTDLTDEQEASLVPFEKDAEYKSASYGCHSCIIKCSAIYNIDGKWPVKNGARPEYETLAAFGTHLFNFNLDVIYKCNDLCNEYGLDTMSTGATIAWAMDCFADGLLKKDQLDGIDLTWGNEDAIVEVTEKIGKAEGVGAIFANGSAFAADYFGCGHDKLAVAGRVEFPMQDSRWVPTMARTFKYDPVPARHLKGGYGVPMGFNPPEIKNNYSDKGEGDLAATIDVEIRDATGFCFYADGSTFKSNMQICMINAITGFNYDDEGKSKFGRRAFTMRSAFNLREGLRRKDYDISPRMIGIPKMGRGVNADVTVDVEQLADDFFKALHWHIEDAVPTKESMEELGGLELVIADLYSNG